MDAPDFVIDVVLEWSETSDERELRVYHSRPANSDDIRAVAETQIAALQKRAGGL